MEAPNPSTPSSEAGSAHANPAVVVAAITVIGVAAVILGSLRLVDTIRAPFAPVEKAAEQATSTAAAEEAKLKSQDTDRDGLNDFDELTLTSTSPFLADSDSDGADDNAEYLAGTNPNCPQGVDCSLVASATGNVNASAGANTNSARGVGADVLRNTLKEAGAPAYLVDSTDDDTLYRLYDAALGDTNTNASDAEFIAGLQTLDSAEIRQLLQGAGADPTLLEQVDDASLKTIFDRALQEETTAQP